jgi:hypothetical protein
VGENASLLMTIVSVPMTKNQSFIASGVLGGLMQIKILDKYIGDIDSFIGNIDKIVTYWFFGLTGDDSSFWSPAWHDYPTYQYVCMNVCNPTEMWSKG